jgi:hypothetical protein
MNFFRSMEIDPTCKFSPPQSRSGGISFYGFSAPRRFHATKNQCRHQLRPPIAGFGIPHSILSLTPGRLPSVNSTRPCSSAMRMADTASSDTRRRSRSKSTTVESPKPEAFAKSGWVQSTSARPARHCAGVINILCGNQRGEAYSNSNIKCWLQGRIAYSEISNE